MTLNQHVWPTLRIPTFKIEKCTVKKGGITYREVFPAHIFRIFANWEELLLALEGQLDGSENGEELL